MSIERNILWRSAALFSLVFAFLGCGKSGSPLQYDGGIACTFYACDVQGNCPGGFQCYQGCCQLSSDGGSFEDGGVMWPDGGSAPDGGSSEDGGLTPDGGSSEDGGLTPDGGVPEDGGAPEDGGVEKDGGSEYCPRNPAPEDRIRKVVVSHPYDSSINPSGTFEVLELSASGTLSATGTTFQMTQSRYGKIVFTPDGEVGLLAQESDGSLGVFRFNPSSGQVQVTHASFQGSFYAAGVVMDPTGARAFILDSQTRNNGGGIYSVRIHCDGTIADEGLVAASKLPYAMHFVPGSVDKVVLSAGDILSSTAGYDAHLLKFGASNTYLGGTDAFGDDLAIVSSSAITPDGVYFLIGDNNEYSGIPTRIAVAEIQGNNLVARQVLTPVNDPMSIAISPYGNAGIVVSGYGHAIFELIYDPGYPLAPFSLGEEVKYSGGGPSLPDTAVTIERGRLKGRVLISDVSSIRQLQFGSDGTITDLGVYSFGQGYQNMVGALGIQP